MASLSVADAPVLRDPDSGARADADSGARADAPLAHDVSRDVDRACARIAPTWPLDRFIAVNPLWGFIDRPLPEVSSRLSALAGSRLVMPRAWYREQWRDGRLHTRHLEEAITRTGATCTVDRLTALLEEREPAPVRRPVVADIVDAERDLVHDMAWCDFIAHSLGQFCAAWFDQGQAQLGPDRAAGLYPAWRRFAERDLSPVLLMGLERGPGGRIDAVSDLPERPHALIAHALELLEIPAGEREAYLTALLMRVNGWAAWCAYLRWQARLGGSDDDTIVHLLAIRLAWECVLYRARPGGDTATRWRAAMAAWPAADAAAGASQTLDWVLQRALEIAYQEPLCRGLARRVPAAAAQDAPAVQAAFCIDVRSEVFRRALEATSPGVRTLGFAGFFGLPIDYQPLGACERRPQLPGLLAPGICARDQGAPDGLAEQRALRLDVGGAWKQFATSALSAFSFVETAGLLYAGKLLGNTLGRTRPVAHPEQAGLTGVEQAWRRPRLVSTADGGELTVDARTELAAGVLRAMTLTGPLARIVLLAGHGSDTVNNPHAAGLDCGACGGQTGEVNARAAVALLNDPQVREGLATRGIRIPAATRFVAGLHNTTTDTVTLFDRGELPLSHQDDLETLERWLAEAGRRARAERAGDLGLGGLGDDALRSAISGRARDWSEVRPEWGLANNAAFIVCPRERCRHLDLEGRAFLHDYRWQDDEGFGILELIMTAPMVVTQWINFQYYASTVDHPRFGAGNKVLHNVVGGNLGVFEGNGGDLRIGLPLQSLHDGTRWMHTPLRLSVFIDAPAHAIDGVIARHETVRQLVDNEWLFLFRIDGDDGTVSRYCSGRWEQAGRAEGDGAA